MSRKSTEDLEVEEIIRAWIRSRSHELEAGVNELARIFGGGVTSGQMSKVLAGQGFSAGFIRKAHRALDLDYKTLLERKPDLHYFNKGTEYQDAPPGRPRRPQGHAAHAGPPHPSPVVHRGHGGRR